MSTLPSPDFTQHADAISDFHRSELDLIESTTGRVVMHEALDIIEGRSRLLPTRIHLLAMLVYANSFRESCDERDLVITKLLTSHFHETQEALGITKH